MNDVIVAFSQAYMSQYHQNDTNASINIDVADPLFFIPLSNLSSKFLSKKQHFRSMEQNSSYHTASCNGYIVHDIIFYTDQL